MAPRSPSVISVTRDCRRGQRATGGESLARGAAQQREEQIRRDRLQTEQQAAAQAESERAAAEARAAREQAGAERSVKAAEQSRLSATEEANRLEREASEAERRADRIDPKRE